MDTHTHIHTYTQDNYSNPRCTCTPRVNESYKQLSESALQTSSKYTSASLAVECEEYGTSADWKLLRNAHTHTMWLLSRARESGIVSLHNYAKYL